MTNTQHEDVVSRALAEVAKARAFRERTVELRKASFGAIPPRTSVYVVGSKQADREQSKCTH